MNDSPLDRDLALRIGLAARELPGLAPGELVAMLVDAVGLPLAANKLAGLKLKELRAAGGERLLAMPPDSLKAALRLLKGADEAVPAASLPQPAPYAEGDLPGSIRVAVASNSGEQLDGHFGSCARFLIYQLSPGECRLIALRSAAGGDDGDDKTAHRAGLVADCQVLFTQSIGGPAAAKVVKRGVHPIKQPLGGPARAVLADLQGVLAGSPPPWLARVMGRDAKSLAPFRPAAEAEEAS
jgi:nitrogen fixation protein NifX